MGADTSKEAGVSSVSASQQAASSQAPCPVVDNPVYNVYNQRLDASEILLLRVHMALTYQIVQEDSI